MKDINDVFYAVGIIPVIKLPDADAALPLAAALMRGGVPVAEITFRSDAAEESIRRIREKYPDMFVGAGTVLTEEQADRAVKAGAQFLVSPGLNSDVVKRARALNTPIIPGVSTATEIEAATSLGLSTLKFFPAEQIGGIATIEALCAPYQGIRFIPTGGINNRNICGYLASPKVIACGGSWMVNSSLLEKGDFASVESLAREAICTAMGFSIAHVGINFDAADDALSASRFFEHVFGFAMRDANTSIFSGTAVECMKTPGAGTKGHIAIWCNNIRRAVKYLEIRGAAINHDKIRYNEKGEFRTAFLQNEVGGFAVHLLQKN